MGGANIGFADGHAAWWSAEAILNASPDDPGRESTMSAAQWQARQSRQNLLLGFTNGICGFPGAFQ
jgi:prepilin-type processing-associated H-X9-DG protein